MSATPIPYLLEELQGGYALGTIFAERSISSFPDAQLHIVDAPPAQTRNPYSRWWLWIPGSLVSLAPRNDR